MTVSTTSSTQDALSGDGSNKTFQYSFRILSENDLDVRIRTISTGAETAPLTVNTDYTVTNVGADGGGNVVLSASFTAPTTDEQVFIKRVVALTQNTDYTPNDPFPAAAHEDALDKLTFIAQQQQEVFDRAVVFPDTDTADTTIPDSVTRANKFLGFGASGEVVVLDSTGAAPSSVDTGTIVDGAVTTAKLASTAVTTAKITDDAVTQAKIADDAVGSDQIADDAVTVAKININGGELVLDSDGDTSITADTDDQIDFKTGGTDRLVIDSSGNVGIGRTPVAYGSFKVLDLAGSSGAIQKLIHTGSSVELQAYSSSSLTAIGSATNHPFVFTTNDSERMRIESSGRVKVATTSQVSGSAQELFAVDAGTSGGHAAVFATNQTGGFSCTYMKTGSNVSNLAVFYRDTTKVGSITTNGTTTAFNTTSDHRVKENVADMTGAIDRVKALSPKRFNFIADPDDTTVDGFLAHEAQTVVPEAVTGTHNEVDDDGNAVMQGIDQAKLVPLLTGALKEAITKIEALEARVTTLENA